MKETVSDSDKSDGVKANDRVGPIAAVAAMQNETSDRDLHSDLFPNFFENLFPDRNNNNIDEEPLYVNAKQYFRILKRRVARTRLEEVHRLSRQRKVSRTLLRKQRNPVFIPLPALSSRVSS